MEVKSRARSTGQTYIYTFLLSYLLCYFTKCTTTIPIIEIKYKLKIIESV